MSRARLCCLRLAAWGLPLACLAASLGCSHPGAFSGANAALARAQAAQDPRQPQKTEPLPAQPARDECTSPPALATHRQAQGKTLMIDLATVLRLAEDQNSQVALARERLNGSQAEKDLADKAWLPSLNAGAAWYRHEGGIQNQDGTLTKSSFSSAFPGLDLAARMDLRNSMFQRLNAERQLWQDEGELARVSSDTALEAANTYIDLLAARLVEVVLRRGEAYEKDLLQWYEDLLKKGEKGAEVIVETVKAHLAARRQLFSQVRQQGAAAAAKLAYLLGLPPETKLEPADGGLRPIALVNAAAPTEELIAQALAAGPGVRELEQVIGIIQDGIDKSSGPGRFIPIVEMRMQEGAIGAGPNSTLDWTNRFDFGIQMRWNLTDLATASDKRRLAHSKMNQAQLTYQDLRGKLAAGVIEAQDTIGSGEDQIKATTEQIRHACKSYSLSNQRIKQRIEGSSPGEVLAAIRFLETSHLSSLNVIRGYNKAQVRLMILLGAAGIGGNGHCPH